MSTAPRDAEVPPPHAAQLDELDELDEVVLRWTVHLLRGQQRRLPRVGLAALLVLAGGMLVLHSLLFALPVVAAFLLSLSEFLFPLRYTLTRRGAAARQGPAVLEIAWRDVRHAYLAPDGVKLSPLPRHGSRMEPLRGVFLRFAGNDEAVIAAVRCLREEDAADG